MLRAGLSWKNDRNNVNNGSTLSYWLTDAAFSEGEDLEIFSQNKSFRPSVYFYGLHTMSDTETLDYVVDAYYSRNDFDRSYDTGKSSFSSLVKESYYYTKVNANYSMTMSHQNKLTFMLYEFPRISDSEYSGSSEYS